MVSNGAGRIPAHASVRQIAVPARPVTTATEAPCP